MQEQILKFCLEKGILLDKEIFNFLKEEDSEIAKEIIGKISESIHEKFITRASFDKNKENLRNIFDNEKKKYVEKLCVNLGIRLEIIKEVEETVKVEENKNFGINGVKVLDSSFSAGRKIGVEDFVIHLRARFNELRRVLQIRSELNSLVSLNKLSGNRQNVSIIGIVNDKRITKNKNILVEIEDLTGRVTALINSNKPEIFAIGKNIVQDDIIGISGASNGELFFINSIVYPDSWLPEKKKLKVDESVAFTSDVHVGSKMFLEKNFLKFISWLNGERGDLEQRKEALKVKYLFLTGDCVDGVGIYPGQEELLEIKDVSEQYGRLAELLGMIRKDVKIIMCPGQHDAVRVAEPQPAIGRDYASKLYELDNVILVSNPGLVEIGTYNEAGMKVLMYHGASMHGLINDIEDLRVIKAHDTPSKVVRHLLLRRHLAPTHSSVTYIPGERDNLVIREVPDIIITGDLHKPDIDVYNNVLIVCSSCWQSITPFEEKVGNHPDPCKVPIFNLKTRAIKVLDFSGEEDE